MAKKPLRIGRIADLGEEEYKRRWREKVLNNPEVRARTVATQRTPESRALASASQYAVRGRPCIVYGVEYRGPAEAAKAHGISAPLARYRCRATTPAFRFWQYKEEPSHGTE